LGLEIKRKSAMSKPSSSPTTGFSSYALMIVFTLALSLMLIILGAFFFSNEVETEEVLLLIGFLGLALSTYVLFQTRRRIARLKIEAPKTLTTIECQKCGFKNVREFQRGDFIFKDFEPCQKCNDKMMITAIYREEKKEVKPS
jgi:hypothetical protein